MVRKVAYQGIVGPESYYRNGQPNGTLRESFSRIQAGSDLAALTTQVMTSVALYLEKGEPVTYLTFVSGGTAAGTPTNWWFALYDTSGTPALLRQTADQLTAAWAANTAKRLALSTPYVATVTGIYRASVMVKATTVPTLAGATVLVGAAGAAVSGQVVLAQTSGASLTTTAPSTIATPTTVATLPYCAAS